MSILFFSRGRSRTQLQLIPRSLQKATSSVPGPSAKSSTAASGEKTESNGASQSSEPAKKGFTNEYFRNLMLKKNWKPISNIEKVSIICDLYENPHELFDCSSETQKLLHDMKQANPAFSLDWLHRVKRELYELNYIWQKDRGTNFDKCQS